MDETPSAGVSKGRAYFGLWLVLGAVVMARRIPPADLDPLPSASAQPFSIDLNRASWQELVIIEGIGESLAKKIVAARAERGGFRSIEEVMAVPGVPDRPFQRGRAYLTLSGN